MNKKRLWQKRYLILTHESLIYKENSNSRRSKGSIDIRTIQDLQRRTYSMEYQPNSIIFTSNNREYAFSFPTPETMLDWYYNIQFRIYHMS